MPPTPPMNDRHLPPLHPASGLADPGLPPGTRLGPFEVQRLIARSASSAVYLATDHALALAVAVQEYLPSRLVHRDAALRLHATDEWHEDVIARGLRAFVDEARLLAHCDHPALVRVNQLFEANGTAYRVMPYYSGRRLVDIRRDMPEAPDEASLRSLLEDLLGALEAIHQGGRSHGGVTPGNIMLLGDDRPLLLGPGAAGREIGSDLVETLMATIETPLGPQPGMRAAHSPAHGAIADLRALAEVTRFCITGTLPPPAADPARAQALVKVIAQTFEPAQRPRYSAGLLRSLDAALSPLPADWPTSAAQFRAWLDDNAPPPARQRAEPVFDPFGSPAPEPAPRSTGGEALARAGDTASLGETTATRPTSTALPPPVRPTPSSLPPVAPAAGRPVEAPTFADTEFAAVDRAPWVAPALSRAPNRARRYKLALAAGLTVLAIGVLGLVSGGWNMAPEIAVERPLATAPAPTRVDPTPPVTTTTAPPPPAAATATSAETSPGPAASATAALAAGADTAAASAPVAVANSSASLPAATTPAAAPASEAATLAATPAPPSTVTPPQQSPSPAIAGLDPERMIERNPPAAAPRQNNPPPAPRAPTSRQAARGENASPRAACSGRTEFALYRCMQQVCRASRWQLHPQCVRLRANDRVD
ncbi:serine/threonine protein kinase [Rhizobacter fulvus]